MPRSGLVEFFESGWLDKSGQTLNDRPQAGYETLLKGLILAQNERWRRGLGMQVERIPWATGGEVAKGAVRRG